MCRQTRNATQQNADKNRQLQSDRTWKSVHTIITIGWDIVHGLFNSQKLSIVNEITHLL